MKHEVSKQWEPHEDILILELIKQHGRKWEVLKLSFPGRSTSSIRNRWQRMQKFTLTSKNKCARCGLPKCGHICKVAPSLPPFPVELPPSPVELPSPPSLPMPYKFPIISSPPPPDYELTSPPQARIHAIPRVLPSHTRKMPPLTSPHGEFYNLFQDDLPMVSKKDSERMMANVRREHQQPQAQNTFDIDTLTYLKECGFFV